MEVNFIVCLLMIVGIVAFLIIGRYFSVSMEVGSLIYKELMEIRCKYPELEHKIDAIMLKHGKIRYKDYVSIKKSIRRMNDEKAKTEFQTMTKGYR